MINLLRSRRSIRKYLRKPVDKASLNLLIEALLRSPSSRNIRPWEFIMVDDRKLLSRLAKAKEHGSEFLKHAALGIVVCADSAKSDTWVEDCSIASILVQMAAQSLGLGSCWIQIRNRDHSEKKTSEAFIRELFGLPERVKVESIISIGYPNEIKKPIAESTLKYQKIRHNQYTEYYSLSTKRRRAEE